MADYELLATHQGTPLVPGATTITDCIQNAILLTGQEPEVVREIAGERPNFPERLEVP